MTSDSVSHRPRQYRTGWHWVTEFHEDQLVATSFPRGSVVEDVEWTNNGGVESGYETRGYRNVSTCYGAFDEGYRPAIDRGALLLWLILERPEA